MQFTKADIRFFSVAAKIAETSNHQKSKIGSIIVYNKAVIAVGVNQHNKSHPLQKLYNNRYRGFDKLTVPINNNIHAELDAIIKIRNLFFSTDIPNTLKIYTVRVLKDGSLANAKPCPACAAVIHEHNIKNIFYSVDQGYAYEYYQT